MNPDQPPITCVKLSKWCATTDDTSDAVHARRKRREWVDGVHCHLRGGVLWIDTVEAQKWIKGQDKIAA